MTADVLTQPETTAAHYADATRWIDQAVKAGCHDPTVLYMLGCSYKHMGKTAEARSAFRRIAEPDANVWLQLGLLSIRERAYPQAAEEFAKAWDLDPAFYAAAFNLVLARLWQGELEACVALLPKVRAIAPTPEQERLLALLDALLIALPGKGPPPVPGAAKSGPEAAVASASANEEEKLIQLLGGLNQFEVAYPLLLKLANLRPDSPRAHEPYLEVTLLQAKQFADRGRWKEASDILMPLSRAAGKDLNGLALVNMLGCCAFMLQDFEQAVVHFKTALKIAPTENAWLHQNLAVAYELQGRLEQADGHWNRYFDLLAKGIPIPPFANYLDNLAFEGLNRLADVYTRKEKWNQALSYLQRASRLRPKDADILERLFHLYNQLKRPEEAKKALRRLKEARPADPQFELYDLDVRELRTVEDIDRMLVEIRRVLQKHPGDMRVEERATAMASNMVPMIERMVEQLSGQASRVVEQMRRLPNYQINWRAVRDVARDLQDEFLKLRRINNKCLQLVTTEEQRRTIQDLNHQIDRKVELCHSLGG